MRLYIAEFMERAQFFVCVAVALITPSSKMLELMFCSRVKFHKGCETLKRKTFLEENQ